MILAKNNFQCRRGHFVSHKNNAFTLIELLVVVAIIGILAGILTASIGGVIEKTKKLNAKVDSKQIADSILLFKQEYNRYPNITTETATAIDGAIMDVLRGKETAGANMDNPKKITFLEPRLYKSGRGGFDSSDNIYKDPWDRPYMIVVDKDYDGKITAPSMRTSSSTGSDEIIAGVIAYSLGEDGDFDVQDGRSW